MQEIKFFAFVFFCFRLFAGDHKMEFAGDSGGRPRGIDSPANVN